MHSPPPDMLAKAAQAESQKWLPTGLATHLSIGRAAHGCVKARLLARAHGLA
jgi:hypothetical protein